jgi:hypothetical protein
LVVGLIVCAVESRAADPSEFTVGAFTFQRPAGWGWVTPASPMRKAQLTPPATGSAAPGEVTFFHFGPGQGGSVEQNIQRWTAQFHAGAAGSNAMQKVEQYGGTKVTSVSASGTFQSGMPGGPTTPREGYALLGAILESPGGNVFVKMTGPAETVRAATAAFEAMIKDAAQKREP